MNTTAVLLLLVGSLFGVILMYVLTLGTLKTRVKERMDELEDRVSELEETFDEELDSAVEEALAVLQASLAEVFKDEKWKNSRATRISDETLADCRGIPVIHYGSGDDEMPVMLDWKL